MRDQQWRVSFSDVEMMAMATKLKPNFERNNLPQPGVVPCINVDCDNVVSMGTGTGVNVTYPEDGPEPTNGWLCPDCAECELV